MRISRRTVRPDRRPGIGLWPGRAAIRRRARCVACGGLAIRMEGWPARAATRTGGGRGAQNGPAAHLRRCARGAYAGASGGGKGGPDLLGMGEGGSEIGAGALWGRARSVYRNLQSTHGKAALTINGGGTGDAAAMVAVPSVNESGEASTGRRIGFRAVKPAGRRGR
jgi:hypothetical protein